MQRDTEKQRQRERVHACKCERERSQHAQEEERNCVRTIPITSDIPGITRRDCPGESPALTSGVCMHACMHKDQCMCVRTYVCLLYQFKACRASRCSLATLPLLSAIFPAFLRSPSTSALHSAPSVSASSSAAISLLSEDDAAAPDLESPVM